MFNQLFLIDDDVSYQNSLRCASPLLLARTNMYKVLHNAAVPSTDLNSLFFFLLRRPAVILGSPRQMCNLRMIQEMDE